MGQVCFERKKFFFLIWQWRVLQKVTHRSGCFFSLLYKQVQDPVVMDAQSSFHYLSSLKFKEDMPS